MGYDFTSSGLSTALAESTASSSPVTTSRSDNDQVGAGSTYGAEAAKPAMPLPTPFPVRFAPSLPAGTLVAVVPSSRCWLRDFCMIDGTTIQAALSIADTSWAERNPTLALSTRWFRQQARGIMVNARMQPGGRCLAPACASRGVRESHISLIGRRYSFDSPASLVFHKKRPPLPPTAFQPSLLHSW